jgi:hypothetical protein
MIDERVEMIDMENVEEVSGEITSEVGHEPSTQKKEDGPVPVIEVPPEDLSPVVQSLRDELDKVKKEFDTYKKLASYGMTDAEAIEVAHWQYEKLKDKPENIAEWIKEMTEGAAPIPTVMSPFINKPASEKVIQKKPEPKVVPASTIAGQNITGKVSSQALAEARKKAMQGDPLPLKLLMGRK